VVRQAFAWREMQALKVADEEAESVERAEAAQRETAEREQHEAEMAAARLQASVTREAVAQQLLSQLLDDVLQPWAYVVATTSQRAAQTTEARNARIATALFRGLVAAIVANEAADLRQRHGRDQPKGTRSKEDKKRRFNKLVSVLSDASNNQINNSQISKQPHQQESDVAWAALLAQWLQEAERREAALRSLLKQKSPLVQQERKRGRRETQTAVMRARQAERRNSKAAARKRKAANWSASGRAKLSIGVRVVVLSVRRLSE